MKYCISIFALPHEIDDLELTLLQLGKALPNSLCETSRSCCMGSHVDAALKSGERAGYGVLVPKL